MRPWLATEPGLEGLNALAEKDGVRTESGHPVRFIPSSGREAGYEARVYETGRVPTRPENPHDWFNALAWLAFPRTKARINAMHVAAMSREQGVRGRLRDLLTLFDEGGAVVQCEDHHLLSLLRACRWKELFWEQRRALLASLRFVILGHAVLEKALLPWAGITCKALLVSSAEAADVQAARWLGELSGDATPRSLASVPVFGYPGWLPESARSDFYDDTRYFRPPRE